MSAITLWVHDDRFSKEDVIINADILPGLKPMDLLEITRKDGSPNRGLIVQYTNTETELLSRYNQLQISIVQNLAGLLDISARTDVLIRKIEPEMVSIDYVELAFRDQYIGRGDMWRLKKSITRSCVYKGKKVVTLGIRAQIKDIISSGNSISSGYVNENTKFIFRSESAKYFIFIQMSCEMWHFEEDGDLYHEKCLYGFLPDLFSRWKQMGNNHVLSIVLFSRIFYNDANVTGKENKDSNDLFDETPPAPGKLQTDSSGRPYRDFYRVVVDWEMKPDWAQVLGALRQEFMMFRRDILQQQLIDGSSYLVGEISSASEGNILEAINLALNPYDKHYVDRDLMRTGLSVVVVTPGSGIFEVDKKLCRMTTQRLIDNGIGMDLVCLSKPPLHTVPLFEFLSSDMVSSITREVQEYEEKNAAQKSAGSSGGNSRALPIYDRNVEAWDPLYIDDAPFANRQKRVFFNIPHWIDISYWERKSFARTSSSQFYPRCKMYEVQMMGVMEQVGSSILVSSLNMENASRPPSSENVNQSNDVTVPKQEFMTKYDELVFASVKRPLKPRTSSGGVGSEYNSFESKSRNQSFIGRRPITFGSPDNYETFRSADFPGLPKSSSQLNNYPRAYEIFDRPTLLTGSQLKPLLQGKDDPRPVSASSRSHNVRFDLPDRLSSSPEVIAGKNNSTMSPIKISQSQNKPVLAGSFLRNSMNPEEGRSYSESFKAGLSPGDYSRMIARSSPSKNLSSTGQQLRSYANRQNYINPCNPSKIFVRNSSQIRRWQHVFTRPFNVMFDEPSVNWKSLCTPACLPLTTEYFPTNEELAELYQEYMYTVGPSDEIFPYQDSRVNDEKFRVEALLTELVGQRLAQGFQLIVGTMKEESVPIPETSSESGKTSRRASDLFKIKPYYLCLGDQLHKLSYDAGTNNVEVRRYVRKVKYSTEPINYRCYIWPKGMEYYEEKLVNFSYPSLGNYNWNYLDHLLSGYQNDMTEALRYWRTRFLLIPSETIPAPSAFSNPSNEILDEEELRLAGFNKFVELFDKARWIHPNERRKQTKKELLKTVSVNLTTLNASHFVKEELNKVGGAFSVDLARRTSMRSLSSSQEDFLTRNSTLPAIAAAMQGAGGVNFKDRRWHFKSYASTFIGSECIEWMIRAFKDIETKEEAIQFGNQLLDKGFFEHVLKKHGFLDGHYFYRLNSEYVQTVAPPKPAELKSASMPRSIRKSSEALIDMIPISDSYSPLSSAISGRAHSRDSVVSNPDRSVIELSKSTVIDLDPLKKSGRNEIAFLHYDTTHNPKNCYHFQIHWLVCTARLIEDLLGHWARVAEKCGLKMVEAPVDQVVAFANDNPFQSVVSVPLVVKPPTAETLVHKPPESENWFESELLKKHGFVLDMEADDKFMSTTISYSYERKPYKYTQFVHRSGSLFAQITPNGFLLVNNRLLLASISNTPSIRNQPMFNPDSVRQAVVNFCSNAEELSEFYKECIARLDESHEDVKSV